MNLGRVFLQNPHTLDYLNWQVNNPFCHTQKIKKNNLECYYESWSSCTFNDVFHFNNNHSIQNISSDQIKEIKSMNLTKEEIKLMLIDQTNVYEIKKKYDSYESLLTFDLGQYSHGFIPNSLLPTLQCSPMNSSFYYYWWRAISTSYIIRPNVYFLN